MAGECCRGQPLPKVLHEDQGRDTGDHSQPGLAQLDVRAQGSSPRSAQSQAMRAGERVSSGPVPSSRKLGPSGSYTPESSQLLLVVWPGLTKRKVSKALDPSRGLTMAFG